MTNSSFSNVVAIICIVLSFGIVIMLFFVAIPPENKQLLDTIIPLITGSGLIGIIQFFFGSSQTSATKNETIKQLVNNQTLPQTTTATIQTTTP